MDVVILAGGRASHEMRSAYGVEYRCELPWQGGTILDHVAEVASVIGDVTVVGGPERLRTVEGGSDFVGSLEAGLGATKNTEVILVTADLPFLQAESLQTFVAQSDPDADLNFSVVPVEVCQKQFPQLKRTAIVTREGRLTGGNVCGCRREVLLGNMPLLARTYAKRKSPLALAGLVGPSFIVRFLLGQLMPGLVSLAYLERRVSQVLGFRASAVVCPFADIGTDIDNITQYKAVEKLQNDG